MNFHSLLIRYAIAEGFPLAEAIDIDLALESFAPHIDKYDQWLSAGHEGAMTYLRRGRDRRADPRQLLPEAQSMLCVALPYPAGPTGQSDPSVGPRYARYLRRADYHDDIAEKLERVMKTVAAEWKTPFTYKVCVDTSAVLERSWAALAGLGWIGKNTLLIHPQYGSYLFLGEVLISEKTGQGPKPLPNYCGNCNRCIDSCPTSAIGKNQVLSAERCIAYWTLEKRGELPLNPEDRKAMGTWVAGCDICQEVCPFNTKPARAVGSEAPTTGATSLDRWEDLLAETKDQYRERIKDSSLSRVKPEQFSRNLAIALSNAEDPKRFEKQIEERAETESDPNAKSEWINLLNKLRKQ